MTSIKPIPFKPEMIKAIVNGTKTQTRRIIKKVGNDNCMQIPGKKTRTHVMDGAQYGLCPYGNMPGDLIYAREAWKADSQLDQIKPSELSPHEPRQYLADGKILEPSCMMIAPGKYRPAMFMPRAFSRLTLELTVEVRAEILTQISDEDAEAEGIDFMRRVPDADETLTARQLYEILFTSINGPGSWKPQWVWVITFKPHFCNVNTLLARRDAA